MTALHKPAPGPPRGHLVQLVYVGLLLAAIATSGLLRSFHDHTPQLFPGPLGSLLGIAFLAFLAMHLVQRRTRRDLFPEWPERHGLRPAVCLPLLVVLIGEKWLSVDVLGSAYDWIDLSIADEGLADGLYRLWSGLALLGTSLAMLWVLRQVWHRIGSVASLERLRRAALYGGIGLAAVAALALALAVAGGGADLGFAAPFEGSALAAAIAAQLLRSGAEELFFRGLLQRTLLRLLAEAGLGEGRLPRLLAIVSISVGFSLEHLDPGADLVTNLRALLFVFAVSCALGTLLEVSKNLHLVIAAHAIMNLGVGGLLPLPLAPEGGALLPPAFAGGVFMIAVFAAVVVQHRR